MNGTQLNKTLRRQICYVLQNDVFFTNLTLRQTLVYSAMLRLPDTMSHDAKMRQVDQVIDALDLKSCQNTIIGDYMRRGLSGGEKKRCSIACELLSNPAVMMLDEPTSSLDSCTALSLIKLLKEYAIKEQKTIIISIHQPSSQIFYLFDKLLLLSQGEMTYFGPIQQVLPYFQHFNYHMQHLSYNPADFVMEIIKSVDEKEIAKLSQEARECFFSIYKRNSMNNMSLMGSTGTSSPSDVGAKSANGTQLNHQFVAPNHHHNHHHHQQDASKHQELNEQDNFSSSIHSSWSKIYIYDDHDDAYSYDDDCSDQCCKENKWPSSFLTQLYALTSRNFIDGKARMLSKLNWVQTIGLALIAGAIWFQIKRSEETLTDIKGWMYFSTMYWMMFALFNAITSFPAECQVINKERKYNFFKKRASPPTVVHLVVHQPEHHDREWELRTDLLGQRRQFYCSQTQEVRRMTIWAGGCGCRDFASGVFVCDPWGDEPEGTIDVKKNPRGQQLHKSRTTRG